MDRERAEAYLRQLAEAELRRARTLPAAWIPGWQSTVRLALVEPALVAAGAVDAGTADQIWADLELAVAVRQPGQQNQASPGRRGLPPDARKQLAQLMHNPSGRAGTVASYFPGLSMAYPRPTLRPSGGPMSPSREMMPNGPETSPVTSGRALLGSRSWSGAGPRG